MAKQYQYISNNNYWIIPGTKSGLRSRVGVVDYFVVYEKETALNVWENCGGFGDPGDEIVSGGRCRMGVRGGNWVVDIELTATGFDGTEDTDWKMIGEIVATGTPTYWSTRTVTGVVVTAVSDTSLYVTWTNNGATDYTGHKIYISTDNVTYTLNKTVASIGTSTTLTGLTADTLYYVKVAPYQSISIGTLSSVSSSTTFVAAYAALYTAFTSKPATQESQYQNTFIKRFVDGGIWAKIDAAWWFGIHTNGVGGDALFNIKNPAGTKATNNGTTHRSYIGFIGNGSDQYIDTGWNPAVNGSNYQRNSASVGAYCDTVTGTAATFDAGVGDGTQLSVISFASNSVYDRAYINSLTYTAAAHVAYYTGFRAWNRSGSNDVQRYENRTSTGVSRASVGVPNGNVYVCGYNSSGTLTAPTIRPLSFLFYGGSLSTAELDIIDSALTEYYSQIRVISDFWVKSSNDYFDYYVIRDRYISYQTQLVYQNEDVKLILKSNKLYLTKDNGLTWTSGLSFTPDNDIEFGYVFDNYNILFATKDHIYKSTDELATYSEVTVIDIGGGDFIPSATGNNFRWLAGQNKTYQSGIELVVWGNYTNTMEGNSEINQFYCKNDCVIKIGYKFGQNAVYDSLGDAGNAIKCRHIHMINQNPNDGSFWMQTGDYGTGQVPHPDECHWIRGGYDLNLDTWTWTVIKTGGLNTYFKIVGMKFTATHVYWASDVTGDAAKCGIWKCPIADIANDGSYVQVFDDEEAYSSSIFGASNNDIIACNAQTALDRGVSVSKDLGVTMNTVQLTDVDWYAGGVDFDFFKILPKSTDDWYALPIALNADQISDKGTLMIKLK